MSKIDFLRVAFAQSDPPAFKEPKDGELVLYGDPKEQQRYPDYLIDLASKSARHGAMLKSKVRYICGNGWSVDEFQRKITEVVQIQNLINWKGEDSFQEFTNKIVTDREYIGAFAIECIWNKTHSKIERIAHLPIALLTAVKKGDEYNFCYLPDWKGVRNYAVAKEKPGFREFEQLGKGKGTSEILYVVQARPQKSGETNVYGRPSYEAAIKLIEADGEIANFRLNNVKNGFWASKMITFRNGVPSLEEQKELKRKITDEHTGSSKAGTFVLSFTDGGEEPTVLELTPGELDKLFIDMDKAIETTIGTAHSITNPALMGVATPGGLGQINDVTASYELFYSNYVVPAQTEIEEAINYIYSFNKIDANLKLKKVGILQTSSSTNNVLSSLNSLSPLVATKVLEAMSSEEIRDLVGLKTGKFSKVDPDDYIISQFENIGSEGDEILETFELEKDENGEYFGDDYYKRKHFASLFEALDKGILGAVRANPKVTVQDLSTALKQSTSVIEQALGQLIADGHIVGDIGDFKISAKTAELLDAEDIEIKTGIKYKYDGPKDNRNRKFCARLLSLGRLYTRAELDSIKPSPDAPGGRFSVFDYRGGFWTHKDGEVTPYCRHIWKAVAVKL